MVDFYHFPTINFNKKRQFLTIASGPVIINDKKEFLLHRAESTNKFQFSGGRWDDSKSPIDNAIFRPFEDLGVHVEIIGEVEPFVIQDKIQREGKEEILVLIHYLANIKEGSKPVKGNFGWFSSKEIIEMEKRNELSSPNISLACDYFINLK